MRTGSIIWRDCAGRGWSEPTLPGRRPMAGWRIAAQSSAAMNWTRYLFGFEGRINRAKYWLASLITLALMILFAGLAVGIAGGDASFGFGVDDIFQAIDPESWKTLSLARLPMLVVRAAGTMLFLWIFLAISIKRLHDRDSSAYWMVPFFAVPGLYEQFADRLPDSYLVLPLALIVFALCLWGVVELYFLSGSRKTNRFGPNPLQPATIEPRWKQHREIEMVPHTASPPPGWRVKPEP